MPIEEKKELTEKNRKVKTTNDEGETIDGEKVLPQEPTAIYATAESKHLGVVGTKHTVHRVLAKQLVDKGEASYDAPKVKTAKVELTEEELTALEAELGKKPTAADIKKAIADKAAKGEDL